MRITRAWHASPHAASPAEPPRAAPEADWQALPKGYAKCSPPRCLTLFPPRRAPRAEDIKQDPNWQNCHVLGPAQAVVARYPFHPHWMMRVVAGGVRVRYFDVQRRPCSVELSQDLLKRGWLPRRAGARGSLLWPAYLEKAWAAAHGGARALMRRHDPSCAFVWLLGGNAFYSPIDSAHCAAAAGQRMAQLFNQGECMVVHRRDDHCLSVLNCEHLADGKVALHLLDPRDLPHADRKRVWVVGAGSDDEFKGYATTVNARQSLLHAIALDRTAQRW